MILAVSLNSATAGKFVRVFGRQLELASLAADHVPWPSVSISASRRTAFAQDRAETADRQDRAPRRSASTPALDAHADFQVGRHQHGAFLRSTSSLTFCRIGLGLRVGATAAAVWNAAEQLLAFTGDFHGSIRFAIRDS